MVPSQLLVWLRGAHLNLKPQKCELFHETIEYLGHQVSRHVIRSFPGKVDCLHSWNPPVNVTQVIAFLDFT